MASDSVTHDPAIIDRKLTVINYIIIYRAGPSTVNALDLYLGDARGIGYPD
jgi:hypothetical protein